MKKLIILIVLTIISCESTQDRINIAEAEVNHIKNADYGKELSANFDYEKKFKEEAKKFRFKDPDTLKFRNIKKPTKGFYGFFSNPYGTFRDYSLNKSNQNNRKYGYVVNGEINAKTEAGGYGGYDDYCLFIRNEKIIKFEESFHCKITEKTIKELKDGMAKDK
ncbi:MAG: hypothetical protein KDK90_26890 [Leptospiraceae bacterium]|nr:hypothetical protein [Leptospiraceae bacterium]MCB9074048.1 hypothetical protein [Chitinophagales bacterium]